MTDKVKQIKKDISKERKELMDDLSKRSWFKKTKPEIQKKLTDLPSEFDGFLKDLVDRPEEIGDVEVVELIDLLAGNFIAIPVFKVKSLLTKEEFTYEYASWKFGRFPGNKGIILVEVDNKIKYFLLKKGPKFPTASEVYDAIGTFGEFSIKFSGDKMVHLPRKIEKQIKKLLGVDNLQITRFLDLGLLTPDPGMSNNHTAIFALIIHGDEAKRVKSLIEGKKLSALPAGYEVEMHPIESLLEFVAKTNDSFFLACVARLAALNIVKLQ